MKFEVTILGNNSAFPSFGRFPTAQVLNYNESLHLIDCGEGTQMRLSDFRIKRSRINHIFISHLHGDHVYGLPGLLNSYAHMSRTEPMHIYGPKGIRQMIDTVLRLSSSIVSFDIVFHELEHDGKVKVHESDILKVFAFPMKHRVPTYGYAFYERKGKVNVRKDAIKKYELSIRDIRALQYGKEEMLIDGNVISSNELVVKSTPRSYAFCSDTIYDIDLVPHIKGVNLLYHEATFMHDLEHKAIATKHTTAFQAGMIARLAEVKKLIIGHFSSRYRDVSPLVAESKEAFPEVEAANEGVTFEIV